MKAKKMWSYLPGNSFWQRANVFTASLLIVWICNTSTNAAPLNDLSEKPGVQEIKDVPLTSLEGFYQFPNKVAYIQFEQQGGFLVAKQVWDNRIYHLERKDDLHFESKEEGYKIEFLQDEAGRITGAKILERALLTKVSYNPSKVIALQPHQLKRLEGTYLFQRDKNHKLTITTKGKGLELVQQWDGKSHFFLPRSEEAFLNEDLSFPLTFVIKEGHATQVICFTNDVWDKIK